MRKSRVALSPAADEDLIGIWGHVALESTRRADRVYDKIVGRIYELADFPQLGRSRPDVAAELRALTAFNYLILYRIEAEQVVIVRVVHGARDLPTLL